MSRLQVALLEPWRGGSHGDWVDGLVAHCSHEVSVIGLPDRAWRWRLRASAPWFAEQISRMATPPDLLLVSGLVDVAVLRGLVGRHLPLVLYMHETQAAYPRSVADDGIEAEVRNWSSMLAADQIWFNSAFHLDTALAAAEHLEAALPEEQRVTSVERLRARSSVVYPGVDLAWIPPQRWRVPGPPVILWPHRWEQDKNPDVFERALDRLADNGCAFQLIVAGKDGTPPSAARSSILNRHAERLWAVGPFDRPEYRRRLMESDIVVSCTGHEFFGIGVVEALAAGAQPVLPNDFSYPELIGGGAGDRLYASGSFGTALEAAVRSFDSDASRVDVSRFAWQNRIGTYDALLTQAARSA